MPEELFPFIKAWLRKKKLPTGEVSEKTRQLLAGMTPAEKAAWAQKTQFYPSTPKPIPSYKDIYLEQGLGGLGKGLREFGGFPEPEELPYKLKTPGGLGEVGLAAGLIAVPAKGGAAKKVPAVVEKWLNLSTPTRKAIAKSVGLEEKVAAKAWETLTAAEKRALAAKLAVEPAPLKSLQEKNAAELSEMITKAQKVPPVGKKVTPTINVEGKELLRRLDTGEWDINKIPVNLEKIAYDNKIPFVGQNAQGIPSTPQDLVRQLREKLLPATKLSARLGNKISKDLDVTYNGIQKGVEDIPDTMLFTDKQTGGTFAANTAKEASERLVDLRAQFAKGAAEVAAKVVPKKAAAAAKVAGQVPPTKPPVPPVATEAAPIPQPRGKKVTVTTPTPDERFQETVTKIKGLIGEAKESTPERQALVRAFRKQQDVIGKKARESFLAKHPGDYAGADGAMRKALSHKTAKFPEREISVKFTKAEIQALTRRAQLTFVNSKGEPLTGITLRTTTALQKLLDKGKLPTPGEIELLDKAFPELTPTLIGLMPKGWLTKMILQGVITAPRVLQATFDLSAFGRQGFMFAMTHPTVIPRAFKAQLAALRSEKVGLGINDLMMGRAGTTAEVERAIEARSVAGLGITDLRLGFDIGQKEEAYIGNWLLQFLARPGVNSFLKIPAQAVLAITRPFERAYVTYLNKLRWDVYHAYLDAWTTSGKKVTIKMKRELAQHINRATGRGELWVNTTTKEGKIVERNIVPFANAAFFAPKLVTSRATMLWYLISTPLDPAFRLFGARAPVFQKSTAVRNLILRDLGIFTGAGIGFLSLLSFLPGVSVEKDPRSTDFGRIRVGNTRIDIWAGFQPFVRAFAQAVTGKRTTTGGRTIPASRLDTLYRFIRTKFSPAFSAFWDIAEGKKVTGEDLWSDDWGIGEVPTGLIKEYMDLTTPLVLQNIQETVNEEGWMKGLVLGSPEAIGFSTLSYDSDYLVITELKSKYQQYLETKKKFEEYQAKGKTKQIDAYYKKYPFLQYGAAMGKIINKLEKIDEQIRKLELNPTLDYFTREQMIRDLEVMKVKMAENTIATIELLSTEPK